MLRTMRLHLLTLIAALFLLSATGCFRQDIRTEPFDVPQMKSANCASIIVEALYATDGIITNRADLDERRIYVTYNSMKLAIKNIEFVIAGKGFDANTTPAPADARAALPPECR
jgi:copper chaperone CopZ